MARSSTRSLLLRAGVASLLVCSATATITFSGTCPTVGATAAINCYDNDGGEIQGNDALASSDAEATGGICYKGACDTLGAARGTWRQRVIKRARAPTLRQPRMRGTHHRRPANEGQTKF
jgi:hypothetical protein